VKKFSFKLQNVLDLREKQLEKKQIEMAVIQNEIFLLNQQLQNLYSAQEKSRKNIEKIISGTDLIDFGIVQMHKAYIEKLFRDILTQKEKIKDAERRLNDKKKEVLEALKAKTTLEKLKENDYKTFLKLIDETERKELDEIAINRYLKKAWARKKWHIHNLQLN